MSHDTEADALDLCERMRITSIKIRGDLDDAMREGGDDDRNNHSRKCRLYGWRLCLLRTADVK